MPKRKIRSSKFSKILIKVFQYIHCNDKHIILVGSGKTFFINNFLLDRKYYLKNYHVCQERELSISDFLHIHTRTRSSKFKKYILCAYDMEEIDIEPDEYYLIDMNNSH